MECQCAGLGFCTNGYVVIIQECISKALGIRETNLRRIGHCGVSVAAVCQNHQLVCALVQLERCCSKTRITPNLIGLLDAGTAEIVYGKIQAAADIHETCPRNSGEWCLLQLGNTDSQVSFEFCCCI